MLEDSLAISKTDLYDQVDEFASRRNASSAIWMSCSQVKTRAEELEIGASEPSALNPAVALI